LARSQCRVGYSDGIQKLEDSIVAFGPTERGVEAKYVIDLAANRAQRVE
jgi:hypothetical protein